MLVLMMAAAVDTYSNIYLTQAQPVVTLCEHIDVISFQRIKDKRLVVDGEGVALTPG